MNFSIITRNLRIVRLLFWVSLVVLSACVGNPTVPQQKGTTGVVSDTRPGTPEQSPYPTMQMVQSPHGNEILSSYSGSYALLIGESQYTHGWSKLTAIPRELQQVEELLTAKGFHVERAMDLKADALESRFKQFIKQYGFDKNNRLLFFYSGHGHTRNDKGYLVPTDAPNPNFDEKGFLQKALGMNQILTWAREIEAKHALFLFDSCFSGMVFKAKALPDMPRQISEMAKLPVRQFITAGSADEPVPAKSVFTPAFIDALRYGLGDLYKDGYVTGEELGLYLKNKVPQHTDQTPQYGKIKDYDLARGDFVFVAGAGKQTPRPVQSPVAAAVPSIPVAPRPVSPPPAPVFKPDSDGDGVADDQDKCPNTTQAQMANGIYKTGSLKGCPQDSDHDRVPDYRDKCPRNRTAELRQGVNSDGCPLDSDQDGVANYRDRCPRNRAEEVRQGVNSDGCPLDQDRDGVADYQDACLGTALGSHVQRNGCPVPAVVSRPSVSTHSSYRYTDNGDGTVTDNRSGLVWLKNANCFGRQNWKKAMQKAANLASGQCGLSDGSRRGMWRLPTKEELKGMIDKRYSWPALSNAAGTGQWKEGDAFSGVQTYYYWSSTTNVDYTSNAWVVYFNDGSVFYDFMTATRYVWPVRGGH